MADGGHSTQFSKLRELAEILEAKDKAGIITGDLVKLIHDDLERMDSLYVFNIRVAMENVVYDTCDAAGRTSEVDDETGERYANDEDAITWLCESGRAQLLASLARLLNVEPPDMVKQALARLESESQAA